MIVVKYTVYGDLMEQMIARKNALPSFAFAMSVSSLLAIGGSPLTLSPTQLVVRVTLAIAAYLGFLQLYCRIRDSARIGLATVYTLGIALAIPAFVVIVNSPEWFGPNSVTVRDYETPVGGYERAYLSDGSLMQVNTASRVHVRYSSNRREICLQRGEALFTVIHMQNRPFVVQGNNLVASAVGTVFSVRLYDDGPVEVLVEQGRVEISAQGGASSPTTLEPGERAILEGDAFQLRDIGINEVERHLRWTEGELRFNSTTLEEAIREFNRYSRDQIVIDGSPDPQVTVGGAFRASDPESFLAVLQRMYPVIRVAKTVDSDERVVFHVTER